MKSPLFYLTAVKLKNQIKAVFKTPSKLIYALFLAAMLALVVFSGNMSEMEPGETYRSLSELSAILTAFYTVMFAMVLITGSTGNASMFTLSDVSLLFPSPISSKAILFYGLLRQMGLSLLLGFFLLFQYAWLHQLYGIAPMALVTIVVCYALTLFLAQLCTMTVYVYTSGKENAGRSIKLCVYGAAALYVLAAAFTCREPLTAILSGSRDFEPLLSAASGFFSTFPGLLFPISGWSAAVAGGILRQDWITLAEGLGLVLLSAAAMVLLIVRAKNNYYEDVLQTAETAQSAITAQKEGQLQEAVPKKVKVGKIGLGKGWGASALYYKHKVENRRSGVFLLSNMSLLFAVIIIVMSFFLRGIDEEDPGASLVGVFAMATYMQLFSSALGRFNRELTKPYIYLVPEPPLKKLLYALQESLIADCVEAVLLFIPISFILGLTPLDTILCMVCRVSFALLFTTGNVLVERVFGTVSSKALIFFFYFLCLLLMAAPGILAGAALAIAAGLEQIGMFLGMAAVNVAVSLIVLYFCRNLLQYAELNNR